MSLADILFPVRCLECGRSGKYICRDCLKKVDGPVRSRPHGLDGLISFWCYRGVIRRAIIGFKYKFAYQIAGELEDYLVKSIQARGISFEHDFVLVPIPLHWYKENLRGFNQAEVLGKVIAKCLKLKFAPHLLIRSKATIPQASLPQTERRQNIHQAFKVVGKVPTKVILFDDVYTTGSTMKEAARVLKKAGAKVVWGISLAR